MVGKCVNKFSNIQMVVGNSTDTQLLQPTTTMYSPMEVATLVCFIVGVIQVNHFVERVLLSHDA